jgi:hypothetical protein
MAIIDLATLTGAQGTIVFGAEGNNDYSGRSVSGAGDVNGDGFDDLIIGAFGGDAMDNAKSNAGESYVIFGGPTLSATIDLANLGPAGITIFGADANDRSGYSVSGAGDINGDGFDDVLIGARLANSLGTGRADAGESYVIFGGASLQSPIDLSNLGTAGITLFGAEAGDRSGYSVSGAGDVNGDGFDDLIVGAGLADASGNGRLSAGESYVIFGGAALSATMDLANPSTAGVTILGAEADDQIGRTVSGAGDVNGDGFDDLLVGALDADALNNAKLSAGESYVIFGGPNLPAIIDLATLGSKGVTIYGSETDDRSGNSVSGAGDVNGDGFDDLIIGAFYADASGNGRLNAGESYVIFGGKALPATIDLAILGTAAGMTLFGSGPDDRNGRAVSGAGDVNGDGFDDLLIGAPLADASNNTKASAGESYVIFGSATLPSSIDLATLGTAGNRFLGADMDDRNGRSVSNAGDVNGDGFDDLILGSYRADASDNLKPLAGESYVIFGADYLGTVTHLGTAAAETLTGTTGANIMIGGRNNDTLIANGGADVLIGGQGDDDLVISDLAFKRIVGGNGSDKLRLNGAGLSLNLTTLRDNRLFGIESIDITGTGNNILSLNQREVLNISDESNTLVVHRNVGDVVNIGTGWTQLANESIGGSPFWVYAQGQARLKVQAVPQASMAGRQVFYNNASGFGTSGANNAPSVNPINAIDATKQPLLPNQTTTTTANYTNYSRGLNGIVVDINKPGNLGRIAASNFQFAIWSDFSNATPNFVATNPTVTLSTFSSGGTAGSDRVKLVLADQAIQNAWLRVTVLADSNTGLAADDVFYFGNARFDVTPTSLFPSKQIVINIFDTNAVRAKQGQNAGVVSSIHDVDRNGVIDVVDTNTVRAGQGATSLRSFTAPSSLQIGLTSSRNSAAANNIDSLFADTSWLETFNPVIKKNRSSFRIV